MRRRQKLILQRQQIKDAEVLAVLGSKEVVVEKQQPMRANPPIKKEMVVCPECEKTVKKAGYKNHQRFCRVQTYHFTGKDDYDPDIVVSSRKE